MNETHGQLMDKIEPLLKKRKEVTAINRIDGHWEMFMEDEKIPIILQVKTVKKEFANYDSFMQYKVGTNQKHHYAMSMLSGKTIEHLVDEIIKNYIENMKGTIPKIKRGYEKDTGQKADDSMTSVD